MVQIKHMFMNSIRTRSMSSLQFAHQNIYLWHRPLKVGIVMNPAFAPESLQWNEVGVAMVCIKAVKFEGLAMIYIKDVKYETCGPKAALWSNLSSHHYHWTYHLGCSPLHSVGDFASWEWYAGFLHRMTQTLVTPLTVHILAPLSPLIPWSLWRFSSFFCACLWGLPGISSNPFQTML